MNILASKIFNIIKKHPDFSKYSLARIENELKYFEKHNILGWLNDRYSRITKGKLLPGKVNKFNSVVCHLLGFSEYFYEPKLAFIRGREKKERTVFDFDIICSLTKESVSKR